MKGRVRLCATTVFKRYKRRSEAEAVVYRAALVGSSGASTPGAILLRSGRTVAFPRIAGTPGGTVIDEGDASFLQPLMRTIARLHAISTVESLPAHDPLAKILPRLVPELRPLPLPIIDEAIAAIGRGGANTRVLHGDLHAGQFVVDKDGKAWLLDLDDMCAGDPAADLGNFCAHLATRGPVLPSDPLAALRAWLALVLDIYRHCGGVAHPALAEAHGRIALVRRALKFREKGDGRLFMSLANSA